MFNTRTIIMMLVSVTIIMGSEVNVIAQTEQLPPVVILSPMEGQAPATIEGTESDGYKVKTTTATGPWGKMTLLDTPYSINVMSSALLENAQVSSIDNVYKMNPVIQPWSPTNRAVPNFIIRGFTIPNTSGKMQDGLRSFFLQMPLEDKERIEVLSGVSGFLYGPANVGGTINYVLKKPTAEPFANIKIGGTGGENYFFHLDLGGPVDRGGSLSYRLNVMGQDGATVIEDQELKRGLISGAIDWRPAENFLVQFNGAYHQHRVLNQTASWGIQAGVLHPKAYDNSKNWLNTDIGKFETSSYEFGTKIRWDINDSITVRAAYQYDYVYQKDQTFINNTITSSRGDYISAINYLKPISYDMMAGYIYGDFKFNTGPIGHSLTIGVNFDDYTQKITSTTTGRLNRGTELTQTSFLIGDDIVFNEKWRAMVGVNRANIKSANYNTNTGQRNINNDYNESKATPTVSLMFKPVHQATIYATYMEALEKGSSVPLNGNPRYTNEGESLKPYLSEQYELGAKVELGGVLLTAALFEINKSLEYDLRNSNNTQTKYQDGRQVHRGLEFTAVGKPSDLLTLYGGMTLMNAKVKDLKANNRALEGKRPANVSNSMFKLYAEYDLPFLRGATLTGGIYYFGSMYADALNTDKLSSVTLVDLGARYRITLDEKHPLTLRLDINNVTNKNYWMNANYLGTPRSIILSVEYSLW
ncbi:MAG: TonB-dependent receptor [Deltaproteobacteria bacterium]|nr:TonB-dependent receptor [Deltaproteobacteria bacterium]